LQLSASSKTRGFTRQPLRFSYLQIVECFGGNAADKMASRRLVRNDFDVFDVLIMKKVVSDDVIGENKGIYYK
jgi:hypothetical protein